MDNKINFDDSEQINHHQIFRFLVLYRWLSLIPVMVTVNLQGDLAFEWSVALFISVAVNVLITLFSAPLNKALVNKPWIILVDLAVCGIVFYLVDGWATPYYLYGFSPLLVAAFFFGIHGAINVATAISAIYTLTGVLFSPSTTDLPELVAKIVGFYLIAGTVGYASVLLKRLQETHITLGQAHRDLKVIHDLATSLQSAIDITDVQEHVLTAVIDDLCFPMAMIGLVDQDDLVITDWVAKARDGQADFGDSSFHFAEIPLKENSGEIATSILRGQSQFAVNSITTRDSTLNRILDGKTFHIFPMILREHPVGVLIIFAEKLESPELNASLESIASQAAIAIGTTMLCIDRARRLAVQEERVRIAREIHDTVSQSLFGISFALDACVKLLPEYPLRVKDELALITELAEKTRRQIRQSIMDIWPTEITAETFAHDLNQYAHDVCYHEDLDLTIRVRGAFHQLTPRTKRCLYRVAQEGVNNIIRHSAATEALVCLTVIEEEVGMIVRDNGRGFEILDALKRERQQEHFGLSGIQERIAAMDGTVDILSQEEVGTAILVMLPI